MSEHTHTNRTSRYEDGQFMNTIPTPQGLEKGHFWSTLYQWIFTRPGRPPTQPIPVHKLSTLKVDDGRSHITWMGHSTLLLEMDGQTVLMDPVFSNHASPFAWLPPKSFFPELPITLDTVEHINIVVISHDHYDHLDMQSIKKLGPKVDHFVVPLGVGAHLQRWGVPEQKIIERDWWQETTLGPLTLTATPARHFSGRSLTGGNQTLWASWAIRGQSENIFFSGDSGYFPGFKEIGDRLGPFDLTMLECGAYNPGWPNVHMFPEQTAQAHQDLRGEALLPIHWGRFNLSLHTWNEPIERLKKAASLKDLQIITPMIGQRFTLTEAYPTTSWWKHLQPIHHPQDHAHASVR
ncbi:MBL fold metallo-hydrolase [Magnetococcus sp. PR-3]|uniref:MBL fold metallo-hydrolase n=1 Tax=Magnetococcus sp. PR-3 TaxID=3120355 RepID=UPI002FCE013F